MAKVILSEAEFLATFKAGDTFWYMTSCFSRPGCIVQATIKEFLEDGCWITTVEEPYGEKKHSVGDLTNQVHGAFTSKEDADVYLAERQHAYATDPELIAQAEEREGRIF